MILILHIIIALSSVAFSAVTATKPTSLKLKTSYALAGGTLGSGILLVALEPQTLTQACISGLAYFAAVTVIIAYSKRKFSAQSIEHK